MEEDLIQQSLDDYDAGKYSPRLLTAHELPLDAHVLEPDEDLQRLQLSRQQLQVTGAGRGQQGAEPPLGEGGVGGEPALDAAPRSAAYSLESVRSFSCWLARLFVLGVTGWLVPRTQGWWSLLPVPSSALSSLHCPLARALAFLGSHRPGTAEKRPRKGPGPGVPLQASDHQALRPTRQGTRGVWCPPGRAGGTGQAGPGRGM